MRAPMKTPEPFPEPKNSIYETADRGEDSLTDQAMIEFAAVLDDFMDEEVVDKQGTAIGTLACYWQSVSGLLVFLGIKVKGTEASGSSPATRERLACTHSARLRSGGHDGPARPLSREVCTILCITCYWNPS